MRRAARGGAQRLAVTCSPARRCLAAASVLLSLAASVRAQTAVGLSAQTDDRFRGVSLTDSKPNLRLNLIYDHSSGWYAGASAAGVEFDTQRRQLAVFGYFGYAQRSASDLGWEIGATAAHFAVDSRYDYAEAFVGLIGQRWNAKASVSPSYFGSGRSTVYAELNGGLPLSQPLSRPLSIFGHVGVLAETGRGAPDAGRRRAYSDASVGLSAGFDSCELRLAWVVADHEGLYPIPQGQRRSVLVVGATYFF
jgi:uncharacterized protein (TIGR02001 family)